jgi:type 2A phosphatase activator TIP41
LHAIITTVPIPSAFQGPLVSSAAKIGTHGISIGGWLILGESGCPIADSNTMEMLEARAKSPLPEMVFSGNGFVAHHYASGATLRVTAESALLSCRGRSTDLKVATAAVWAANTPQGGRKDFSGRTIEQAADYDWTYLPSELFQVSGLCLEGVNMTMDDLDELDELGALKQQQQGLRVIPYEHLKRQEPILWSTLVPLYSTELDDNGIVEFTGRVRVMPTCFFCLFRYFLRLDDVLLRCKDVRVFHLFGDTSVLVETTLREGKLEGKEQFHPADEICRVLPVKGSSTRVLSL